MNKEQLESSYDDEFEQLEEDFKNGIITLDEYNKYSKNLNMQYRDDIEELKKSFNS